MKTPTEMIDFENGSQDPNDEHLSRVTNAIGPIVQRFLERRVGKEFRGVELERRVALYGHTPGSGLRVMRDARKRGLADVELVSRRGSLYRVIAVSPILDWRS